MSGNQHHGRKHRILRRLGWARDCLAAAAEYAAAGAYGPHARAVRSAAFWIRMARGEMADAPASTRRRWACGQ